MSLGTAFSKDGDDGGGGDSGGGGSDWGGGGIISIVPITS